MNSSIVTAMGLAACVAMNTNIASAAMGGCTEREISVPYHVSGTGGTPVSCGACKTIAVGATISYSIVITPGGVGGTVGGSVTVTESFTVCADECNQCNFAVATTDATVLETTCWKTPWRFWLPKYKVVTYEIIDEGTVSLIPDCKTSESISCLCRASGHDCECSVDPPIPADEEARRNGSGSAISNPAISLDVRQFLETDTSGRAVGGMKSLSRHDLVVLAACLPLERPTLGKAAVRPSLDTTPVITADADERRFALVFGEELIEIHDARSVRKTIAKIDQSLVASGAHLDVDGNGVVDQDDVQIVLENIGAQGGVDRAFDHYADVDANGTIDDRDLMLVSAAI